MRIAAVVNDEPISAFDVDARVRLALLSLGQPLTPESIERLRPNILRLLIDERIQMQEAKARGVSATDEELQTEIASIERGNQLELGGARQLLARNQIPMSTLESQLRARIMWQKVVVRRLRQSAPIGEEEITEALEELRQSIGKPEYLVAEIVINHDESPQGAEDARRTARDLVQQMRAGGNFPVLARQFSQAASAGVGGDIGWVLSGQLDRALDERLQQMRVGQLTEDPVDIQGAVAILLLRDRRITGQTGQTEAQQVEAARARRAAAAPPPPPPPPQVPPLTARVRLQQLLVQMAPNTPRAQVETRARQFYEAVRGATSCAEIAQLAPRVGAGQAIDLGRVRIRELAEPLQPIVQRIPLNTASPPMGIPTGLLILMVCEREGSEVVRAPPPPEPEPEPPPPPPILSGPVSDDALPSREEVARRIFAERADAQARRYIRELRQSAFIDIRQ